MITYRGVDGRGIARTGRRDATTAVEFAEACFGWKWRDVVITNEQGEVVGEMGSRDGRRYWWAEDVPHSGDKPT